MFFQSSVVLSMIKFVQFLVVNHSEVFSLCNSDLTGFYAYEGSLTYPDCNEIVQWIVMENPLWTRRDGLVSISILLMVARGL